MARGKFGRLLDVTDAADRGEHSMTVEQWDRHQRATERAREAAQRTYERDRFDNQRTD